MGNGLPYALVVLDTADPPMPELVVVVFLDTDEAEEFAGRHGIHDWRIAPLAFGADMDRPR